MRILLFICLFAMSLPVFAAAGQRDMRGMRNPELEARRSREKVERKTSTDSKARATTETVVSEMVTIDAQPCPIDKIKTQLSSYCATVVCNSAASLLGALKLGGTNVKSLDSSCQVMVWEEIANRLSATFMTFKMECDKMNRDYASAIEEWQSKYNEMAELQGKTKKQRNVAIGVGAATTVGGTIGGYILGQKNPTPPSDKKEDPKK